MNVNLFKQLNIDQMFYKIQMILMMKTSISNNRILQLDEFFRNTKSSHQELEVFSCKIIEKQFIFSRAVGVQQFY